MKVELETRRARRIVQEVLRRIEERRPEDYAALLVLVRAVRPGHWTDGTIGETEHHYPKSLEEQLRWVELYGDREPCTVYVREDLRGLDSTLAHEFGHACTRREDLDRRNAPTDEWASELAADWYAYRWGFGREIARLRANRDLPHHLGAPGSWVEVGTPSGARRYRISQNFVMKCLSEPDS